MFIVAVGCVCPARSAHAAAVAYIPNQTGSAVTVIDLGTATVTASVPVGAAPIGVAAAPGGGMVYVAQHNADSVAAISTNLNAVIRQIAAGPKPMGVAVSPDGSRLYVTNFLTATASGSGSLWVNGTVTVADTLTGIALTTVSVGPNPTGVAVAPDGGRIFVANSGAGSVSVIDAATNTVTATVVVGANPVGVAASPDGQRVYVANAGSASVSVIDAATLAVSATIRVGGQATGVAVSDDSTRVVVSNSFDNSASVISAATLSVTSTTTAGLGLGPAGVAFIPGGSTALVANARGGSVSSINAGSGAAGLLPVAALGWPVSLGRFVVSTPACALNVSGSATVSADADGVLILRYLMGLRGSALTANINAIPAGRTPAQIEQSIAALNLDADGDGAARSLTDGLLLMRALQRLTDTALISNVRNTSNPSVRSAAQILQWISATHGANCLL